jgi:hypothetical protein
MPACRDAARGAGRPHACRQASVALLVAALSGGLAFRGAQASEAPDRGMTYVRSTPAGARVLLGLSEIPFGTTPCLLRNLPTGSLPVRVELDGYAPYEDVIDVEPAKVATVNVDLEPVDTKVTVTSEPFEAEVYVDGKMRGRTPCTLKGMVPGRRSLRIVKPGYLAWEREVAITVEGPNVIEARLVRDERGSAAKEPRKAVASIIKDPASLVRASARARELLAGGRIEAARLDLQKIRASQALKKDALDRLARFTRLRNTVSSLLERGKVRLSLRSIDPTTTIAGQVSGLDEEGVSVTSRGIRLRVPWERLPKGSFPDLLKKCVPDDSAEDWSAFAEFAMEIGRFEEAVGAISEVRRLGGEFGSLLKRLDLLQANIGP